jgi:cardiolipin synthase A/B
MSLVLAGLFISPLKSFANACDEILKPGNHLPAVTPLGDSTLKLLSTPGLSAHQAFNDAILGAKLSVKMTMFHLTDKTCVDALKSAARKLLSGKVQVLLDAGQVNSSVANKKVFSDLKSAGVDVKTASTKFSITHEKSMIIDDRQAFITAINLTNKADVTRDFGVITTNTEVISEMNSVFVTDQKNAIAEAGLTPNLAANGPLVWSPQLVAGKDAGLSGSGNSRDKLVRLIDSASNTLDTTTENLGDPVIEAALIRAAQRNVHVRLIAPMCDKNSNTSLDDQAALKIIAKLKGDSAAGNFVIRVMPAPESASHPYMHSKMILADQKVCGGVAFVGSVNFSTHSTTTARELGVIFRNDLATQKINEIFEADFNQALPVPGNGKCPVDDRGAI